MRIKNTSGSDVTTYTYDTNSSLSQLLLKTTNGVDTKYVYGLGLIGEEKGGQFKTYHFDYRGSTVAITDANCNVTDTFKYDTYGKLNARTGSSEIIFGYNGRDGVVTDSNGLIYMRARYYSPDMHRFVNADILHGEISDSTSLNRYAYVNGNPVIYTDPTGLFGILALMAIGAGIGALCSGVGSVVSQKAESEINGEEFELDWGVLISDTLWGAVDGGLSFSPLGPTGKLVGGILTNAGNSITNEFVDDEKGVNLTRVGENIVFDYFLDSIIPDFAGDINISKALKETKNTINDLLRRSNEKWAQKQIRRVINDFKDELYMKISGEIINKGVEVGENAFSSALKEYINDKYISEFVLTEDFTVTRK